MGFLGKAILYLVLSSLGALIGTYIVGEFLDYRITFEGMPVSALTPEQMTQMVTRNPNAMEQHTSLVVNGKRIFTVEGGWLMWVAILGSMAFFSFLAHLFIKLQDRRHRQ